jgi:hypothetical protein
VRRSRKMDCRWRDRDAGVATTSRRQDEAVFRPLPRAASLP